MAKPADATHYMDGPLCGRMYYKRCELTGKWMYYSEVNSGWKISNNEPHQDKQIQITDKD